MPEPRRITVGAAPEAGAEVELWEYRYTTRPITRSVQSAVNELQDKINESGADGDAAIGWLAEMIGALLIPNGEEVPAAADLLREKWAADELSVSQLDALSDAVWEAGKSPS